MNDDLEAFTGADFNWVRSLDSIWKDDVSDVPDLNTAIVDGIAADLFRKLRKPDVRAIGHVVLGSAGVGKTHTVGRLRRRVWDKGGWFVLLDIVGLKEFWRTAALCFATSLQQIMGDGRSQGVAVLSRAAALMSVEQ